MIRRSAIALICASLFSGCAMGSSPPPKAASPPAASPNGPAPSELQARLSHLATLITDRGAPGVIIAATIDGQEFLGVSGFADVIGQRRMSGSESIRIGSLTKTYTATVILLLEKDTRLALSDSVEKWLPGLVPNGSHISVYMLLNQTSGLYDYAEDPVVFDVYRTDPSHVWQPEQLISVATDHAPLFPPGERWAYSNTNYILLGLVAEAVSHEPLDQTLRERLFGPLRLRDTALAMSATLPTGAVHGYLTDPQGQLADVSQIDPSEGWAAGGIVSTATDVSRFYAALLDGRILAAKQLDAMLSTVKADDPLIDAYGLGIYEHRFSCGEAWGHDGEIFGYQTFAFARRDGRRSLVAMVNQPEQAWWLEAAADLVFCGGSAA